jgi:DNA-binding LacI/PurR family transcriptional regulator
MRVSQKQIAEALNLSIITVSRALRDHPDLAKDTKTRILQKARELGYSRPVPRLNANFAAAAAAAAAAAGAGGVGGGGGGALVHGFGERPRRVGILLYGSAHTDLLKSDVLRSIFRGLQRECQVHEVETVVENQLPGDVPLVLKNRTVGGVFLFGRYTPEAVRLLGDMPALAVSSFIECEGLPRIVADNIRGMREATEHLIHLGHKKILFVARHEQHTEIFCERADGYLIAMHRAGLSPSVCFLQVGEKLSDEAIRQHSALVCASDAHAYAIQEPLRARGWDLPRECSMVAFDNIDAADHPLKLTSYAPDWSLMGKLAAEILLSRPLHIVGKNLVFTVPGKLVVRASSAPAPASATTVPAVAPIPAATTTTATATAEAGTATRTRDTGEATQVISVL